MRSKLNVHFIDLVGGGFPAFNSLCQFKNPSKNLERETTPPREREKVGISFNSQYYSRSLAQLNSAV